MRASIAALLLYAAGALCPAVAADAVPLAADPALERRVLAIADELRCLVCQNETIAASHADLAVDLRKQIRTQLQDGRNQDQILDYMVQRYGDFVLYRPPLKPTTLLLWLGPFALLAAALGALALTIRQRRRTGAAQAVPSDAELQRARRLLDPETDTARGAAAGVLNTAPAVPNTAALRGAAAGSPSTLAARGAAAGPPSTLPSRGRPAARSRRRAP